MGRQICPEGHFDMRLARYLMLLTLKGKIRGVGISLSFPVRCIRLHKTCWNSYSSFLGPISYYNSEFTRVGI